jgi:hypothetical protein
MTSLIYKFKGMRILPSDSLGNVLGLLVLMLLTKCVSRVGDITNFAGQDRVRHWQVTAERSTRRYHTWMPRAFVVVQCGYRCGSRIISSVSIRTPYTRT